MQVAARRRPALMLLRSAGTQRPPTAGAGGEDPGTRSLPFARWSGHVARNQERLIGDHLAGGGNV